MDHPAGTMVHGLFADIVYELAEGSNIEVAHHVHERGEKAARHGWPFELTIEIGEAILLAVVAVATAWSGYQSALWDGESSKLYATSSRIRVMASQNATRGGQQQVYDGLAFDFWLQAKQTGKPELAREYQKRFRPEYRPAFRAWLATDPFTNRRAPPGPIFMPEYHNSLMERGARAHERATQVFAEGASARETGDKYVRTTVLLATVLFLIAVSQRFRIFKARIALLVVALVLLAVALSSIATYSRL